MWEGFVEGSCVMWYRPLIPLPSGQYSLVTHWSVVSYTAFAVSEVTACYVCHTMQHKRSNWPSSYCQYSNGAGNVAGNLSQLVRWLWLRTLLLLCPLLASHIYSGYVLSRSGLCERYSERCSCLASCHNCGFGVIAGTPRVKCHPASHCLPVSSFPFKPSSAIPSVSSPAPLWLLLDSFVTLSKRCGCWW